MSYFATHTPWAHDTVSKVVVEVIGIINDI